ncbi:MAG TPA: amidase [Vicinamibacterales bacterium]
MKTLCFETATELARRIRTRDVSITEVVQAHLAQIERVNPQVNAIVTLTAERALDEARAKDAALARGDAASGPLFGLPIVHKDLFATRGIRTTYGSPIYRDHVPEEDALVVERTRAAGAVTLGKSNTPEFGAGSQTFNQVFGRTLNPYDATKTCGGSSGGAAVALACGMVPIADGSDLGGSLRNPANFTNIVALRPTVGLVPTAPAALPFVGFLVKGPMARTVDDLALLLSVMAGADTRDPGCYPSEPHAFDRPLARDFANVRIAWCPDLGGLPLDPRVRAAVDGQRAVFEAIGCRLEDAAPPLDGIDDVFLTIRRWRSWVMLGPLLAAHGADMKCEAVQEIEAGARVTASDVGRAMTRHAEILERVRAFEQRYAFTICAVNQVPPFDATIDWPREVAGVVMEHYIAWMKSAYWISATFRPAASVPAAFTADGLPVGVQIVGRHRDDFGVLQLAFAFEQATRTGERRPPL